MRSSSIFLLAAVLMLCAGCAKQPSGPHGSQPTHAVTVGQPAPPIALKDVDGKTVTLAQFRGQPVFINAFATW